MATGQTEPVLVTFGTDFLHRETSGVHTRHVAYGRRVRELSQAKARGLKILVVMPRERERLHLVHEEEGLQVFQSGIAPLLRASFTKELGFRLAPLIVAGSPFHDGLLARYIARRLSAPLQIQCHGEFGNAAWPITPRRRVLTVIARNVLHSATSVRCVSGPQAGEIVNAFGLNSDRVFCAPVPIDHAFLTPVVPELRISPEPSVFFVGRIHEERGLRLWTEAAHLVHRMWPEVRFHIVGSGPERSSFENAIATYLPPDLVTWHGHLAAPNLAALLLSQRGVLLNTAPLESLGRSMIESVVCGMPVVARDTAGSRALEALLPGITRVNVGTPEIMAKATLESLERSPMWEINEVRQVWRRHQEEGLDRLVRSWIYGCSP